MSALSSLLQMVQCVKHPCHFLANLLECRTLRNNCTTNQFRSELVPIRAPRHIRDIAPSSCETSRTASDSTNVSLLEMGHTSTKADNDTWSALKDNVLQQTAVRALRTSRRSANTRAWNETRVLLGRRQGNSTASSAP